MSPVLRSVSSRVVARVEAVTAWHASFRAGAATQGSAASLLLHSACQGGVGWGERGGAVRSVRGVRMPPAHVSAAATRHAERA